MVPLTAKIYEISQTGNLTIQFNKPIILPKIRTTSEKIDTPNRLLLSEQVDEFFYDIDDIVELKVESDFYSEEEQEIQIYNYTLTRMTPIALDI